MSNVNKDKGKNKRMNERTKSTNFPPNFHVIYVRYGTQIAITKIGTKTVITVTHDRRQTELK